MKANYNCGMQICPFWLHYILSILTYQPKLKFAKGFHIFEQLHSLFDCSVCYVNCMSCSKLPLS